LPINIEQFTKPNSNQYHSTKILNAIVGHQQEVGADRLLAITDVDLYIPKMDFVFGEAQLPGKVAIISTHRLKDTTDCGGENLLSVRIIKEAVHELGHTLGLAHCQNSTCVMFFSNSLKDTDQKGQHYCTKCAAKLGEYI